jgi:tartrate-resistant acid phosphatase type 5
MKPTLLVGSSRLLACGSPATRPATEDTLGGADTTTVRTTGGGTGSSGGSGGSGGSTGGGTPTPYPVTRFLVIGDTGKDFDTSIPLADRWTSVPQYVDARGVKKACDAKGGCAFAVMLGDNLYKTGVSGVDDPQWQTKFEQPYADLAFPFHPVYGNHDYG